MNKRKAALLPAPPPKLTKAAVGPRLSRLLFSLVPAECWRKVVSFIESERDIRALRVTCRLFRDMLADSRHVTERVLPAVFSPTVGPARAQLLLTGRLMTFYQMYGYHQGFYYHAGIKKAAGLLGLRALQDLLDAQETWSAGWARTGEVCAEGRAALDELLLEWNNGF